MTRNLQKAVKGDVLCVVDPNVQGYDKLKNLNYDDRLLKDVINGVGQTLADVITEQKAHNEKLLGLSKENETLKLELIKVKDEVVLLRKALENTLKGLMMR